MPNDSFKPKHDRTVFERGFTGLDTIDRHIAGEESKHPCDFTSLLHDLMLAIRIISRDVRRAGINDVLGITNTTNIHGEMVTKLDKYSNEVIKKAIIQGGRVCAMVCEEEEQLMIIDTKSSKAHYVLLFDPLDGSTNIDVNINIGTIFSIYLRLDPDSLEPATIEDVLQPGYKQVAAGYALYGSSTMLVYTTGNGVHAFTYDPTLGEFLLTHKNLKIPESGYIYSVNEGNYYNWGKGVKHFIDYLKTPDPGSDKPYNLRYIATGVADIHRTLYYGGIYLYPADRNQPEGKFRLLYEANPLAMIVEQAGGKASNGYMPITSIIPTQIHQKTPLFIGSKKEVEELEAFIKKDGNIFPV